MKRLATPLHPGHPAVARAGLAGLAAWLALLAAFPAQADAVRMPSRPLPRYAQECAACHMAYPPGLLPAASWQRILRGLDQHYGTDASLDPAAVQQIDVWLQANAGTSRRVAAESADGPPQDRITRSAWFERKHRRVAAEVWQRASVKSRANCQACHGGAERGDFEDDAVRIPK